MKKLSVLMTVVQSRRIYRCLPVILAFLCLTMTTRAQQVLMEKYFDDNGLENAYAITATSDDGYLMAGSSFQGGANGSSAGLYGLVIKANSVGSLVWRCRLNKYENVTIKSVFAERDGGCTVVGYCRSKSADSGNNVYIARLNASGHIVREGSVGSKDDDVVNRVIRASDGGLIVLGSAAKDIAVYRTDSNGMLLWQKRYGGSGQDLGYGAVELANGDVVFVGSSKSAPAIGWGILLVRIDRDGESVWSRLIDTPGNDFGYGLAADADGGFVIAGTTGEAKASAYLVKADANGTMLWSRSLDGVLGALASSASTVIMNGEGDIVTIGKTGAYPDTGQVLVWEVDHGGNTVRASAIGTRSIYQSGNSIVELGSGRYAVAGTHGGDDTDLMLLTFSDVTSGVEVPANLPLEMRLSSNDVPTTGAGNTALGR